MTIRQLPELPILDRSLIGHVAPVYYPLKTPGTIYGRRVNVDNVLATVWEGPTTQYVFPAAAQQMRIISTSVQDGVGGTGLRVVRMTYLDNLYNQQTVDITMNGTTQVLTLPTNILRVQRLFGISAGSTGRAVGTISLTNTAATVTYSIISAGAATQRQCIFTVPLGFVVYIDSFTASAGSSTANHFTEFDLVSNSFNGTLFPGVSISMGGVGVQDGSIVVPRSTPLVVPAMSDILMTVISDAAGANVTANGYFSGWAERIA